MASISESAAVAGPSTEDEKFAIRSQLERLAGNPFFNQSRRYPSFLVFIVNAAINGQTDILKERTLGIEVFGRSANYDTAVDPIVRVTAAEIRKRLAQYYQEPEHEHELRISLPRGSYVPQFHLPGAEPATHADQTHADQEDEPKGTAQTGARTSSTSSWTRWTIVVAVVTLLTGAVAGFMVGRQHPRQSLAEFWEPLLNSTDPILFCVADGQNPTVAQRDAADPTQLKVGTDHATAVEISDVTTIAGIAGILHADGKHYTLRGANTTTLTDLRSGPSIMVGGFDNVWTLRMLQPLRFHFANDPDMTKVSIVDTQFPNQKRWIIDQQQIATNIYRDYAIVARFTDGTVGKPVLVAAGLSNGGTVAAGEFLANPNLLEAVSRQQPPGKVKGVEVVLSTEIINGDPGTPNIEALYFW